jgi:aldehyde dehydrogenase (NAD+)
VVRHLGQLLRQHKDDLAALVTIEAGKISSEAAGEVQEMIDMCDLAVGLSRQLFGLTIASERPAHRMSELWQPLGVCAVITSFNFPVAVWAWNATVALVCGDPVIWKPSEKTVLTALACQALLVRAAEECGFDPAGLSQVLVGGAEIGQALADHPGVALVSATGSTAMGRAVGPRVAARFGRCLLELGGNNAAIVTPSADLDLAVRAIVFAAAGTAGQRCTTLRRLIVQSGRHDEVVERLAAAYASLPIGDPREAGVLVGPLIDQAAYSRFKAALSEATADGGEVIAGGERQAVHGPDAYYVRPALAVMPKQTELVLRETFAPLLYVLGYE